MDIIPCAHFENLNTYRKRRRYQRLDGPSNYNKKQLKIIRLGGTSSRRVWKLRKPQKLHRRRIVSPIKILSRFHQIYVTMMTILAAKMGKWGGKGLLRGKRVARDRQIIKVPSGEEVDSKLVWQVYNRLVASAELRDLTQNQEIVRECSDLLC